MKIGIIGVGAFSTSIALSLALKNSNEIVMWSENKKLVAAYEKTHKIENLYQDRLFPKNISLTTSYEEALNGVQVVFLVTGVSYIESVSREIKGLVDKTIPIVIGTKGIRENSEQLAYEVVQSILKNPLAVLGGPTFSQDVADFQPVGLELATKNKKVFSLVQSLFDDSKVKVVHTYDMRGVSICGCVKNVYAIGAGILNGLGYRESTSLLYLTAVYGELEEILYKCNSTLSIHHGLAGFGDFVLTCSSKTSRNYTYGEYIGKKNKKDLKEYIKNTTVEGVSTATSLFPLFKKERIKAPIFHLIQEIVSGKKEPEALIEILMKEDKKRLIAFFG